MAPLPKQKRIIAFAIKAKRIVQKLFLHAAKKNIALKKAFVRFSSRIPPGSAGNVVPFRRILEESWRKIAGKFQMKTTRAVRFFHEFLRRVDSSVSPQVFRVEIHFLKKISGHRRRQFKAFCCARV